MIYFFIGIMPVNIDNLLLYLPNTTKFGVGFLVASTLIVGIISILFFGYYTDKIAEKYSRKKIFILTNLLWIISYGLASISFNFYYYLFFLIISAIGSGAFLPIGFSMIGDFFPPKERGKKFGLKDEEVAFYDALADNKSARDVLGDDILRELARVLVEKVKANASIDWTIKESVQAKLRIMVKRTLRKYGYPPDKQKIATENVLKQAEMLADEWN